MLVEESPTTEESALAIVEMTATHGAVLQPPRRLPTETVKRQSSQASVSAVAERRVYVSAWVAFFGEQ